MNNSEKQIGLATLGKGATGFYHGELSRQFAALSGRDADCPVSGVAVDFDPINACLPDRLDELAPLVDALFATLDATGTAVYVLPNITLHVAIDNLGLPSVIRARLVHPIDNALAILAAKGFDDITLVGTRHTMRRGPLAACFEARGLNVHFPESTDIQTLDDVRLKVYADGYSDTSRQEMEAVIHRYDNVVIACTELSILNTANAHLDMARAQITAALSRLGH